MKTNLVNLSKIFYTLLLLSFFLFSAELAFAQPISPPPPGDDGIGISPPPPGDGGHGLSPTKIKLDNPLNVKTIEELVGGILNIVLILAVPVIVFFIIYAGFLYATARGNAEQVKKATTTLTYAIIGGVLIMGSVAIAEIVKQLVLSFKA